MNRVYNGCPSSEMQKSLREDNELMAKIKNLEPEAKCTYFPMEERFQVHVWGRFISGFFYSKKDALQDAIRTLEKSR